MRIEVRAWLALSALAAATVVHAADVDSFLITKGQEFRQTNAAAPVQLPGEKPFQAYSSVTPSGPNTVLGATLRLPNTSSLTLTNSGDGVFEVNPAFTNKAQLDLALGMGIYNFTIQTLNDGTNRPALMLPFDSYPPTPHIANWPDAQDIEPGFPLTVLWDPFTNGTANDFIVFSIADTNDQAVATTPGLLENGALNGTNLSAILAAGVLNSNQTYNARLLFVKRAAINSTNIPGATGISGYYKQTRFPLKTLPAPPAAGRVQFSMRNFSSPEDAGPAVVTVTRSGSQGTVSVNFSATDGTAKTGLDYTGFSTALVFANGVTTTNIPITLLDDFLLEGNETVNLTLTSPTGGAQLGSRSNAVLTIADNEKSGAGILQFFPTTATGLESTPTVNVTIQRIGGTAGTVTANFHTVSGSAASDLDFAATNGTVTFGPGIFSRTIPLRVVNDTLDETNETFSVMLDASGGGAALGSNTIATVNITDNDTGGVLAFSSAGFTTNEFGPFALIAVTRSGGAASDVTVDYATENVTALAGSDYYATNGTITFGSNETRQTFAVALINDYLVESNKTLLLHLSHPTGGARLGTITNATLTILDDESTLSFTNASYTISEAGPVLNINVVRTGARISPVTVDFATANGTAISTNDYRGTNGTLAFPPNIGFRTLSIPIANDTLVESNETFTLTLSNPQGGARLGALTNTTATITNNDFGGALTFSLANYPVAEAGRTTTVTINRSGGMASGVSVDFTTGNGSATTGLDYSNATRTVTFNANELSKTILVPVYNDTLDETNETVLLSLTNPQGGGSLGVRSNATITITDNDTGGVVAFSSTAFGTNENSGFALVTVARSGGMASGVSVNFTTQNGVALAGPDYTATNGTLFFGSNELRKTFTVLISDDVLAEGNETLGLSLSQVTGGATLGAISNATLTIRDDESSVAFTNASYTVTEAGPSVSINIVRSGALITPVGVSYSTVNGSAVSTNDYRGTNSGVVVFPPNVGFRTITIPIFNDTIVEGSEAFSVFLHSPTGGVQLGTLTNTTVTVNDNDLGGVVRLSATNYNALESSATTSIMLMRSGGMAGGVSVDLQTSDMTAFGGLDYSNGTRTVTFNANELSKTVVIPINNDCEAEATERVLLTLANASGGASIGSPSQAVLTIQDNDNGGAIAFSTASFSVSEAVGATNGYAVITVSRPGGTACGVTVDIATSDGTAQDVLDYEAHSESLIFDANQTSKQLLIRIYDDADAEGDETVFLTLRDATGGARLGTITNATLTIRDDEVKVQGFYKVTGSISVSGCTFDTEGNGSLSFSGDVQLNQDGNSFDGDGLLIATTTDGSARVNFFNCTVNAAKQIKGSFEVLTSSGQSYSGTNFTGSVSGNTLQMNLVGDADFDTCHLTGNMSGKIYAPATTGFAPTNMNNVSIIANISSGSGELATNGSFEFLASEFNTFDMLYISGDASDASGSYVYEKTGPNTGVLLLAEEFFFFFNERVNLTFTSADSGTYTATVIGAFGTQAGTFNVLP